MSAAPPVRRRRPIRHLHPPERSAHLCHPRPRRTPCPWRPWASTSPAGDQDGAGDAVATGGGGAEGIHLRYV